MRAHDEKKLGSGGAGGGGEKKEGGREGEGGGEREGERERESKTVQGSFLLVKNVIQSEDHRPTPS